MKIGCHCGNTIFDQTDDLSNKAHFIPDQGWNDMWGAIDELFGAVARGAIKPNDAWYKACEIVRNAGTRTMWQCGECGRLYLDDRTGNLQCYISSSPETEKQILRGRDAQR